MSSSRETDPRFRFLFWRTDFVGFAMIVSGLFFLLVNFKIIPASSFVLPRVLGILFTMIGLLFLFFTGAGRWLSWFVIPAGVFLTSGIVTLILGLNRLFSPASASLFSLGLGLTFLAVFLSRRNHWWALIPSGAFVGVAAWVMLGRRVPVLGWHPVPVLLCLGGSFLAIYAASWQKGRMRWSLLVGAIIAAGALFYLLGILLARWSALWPVLLLLAGVLVPPVLFLADRRRPGAS
jgi:hypothetical protein